MRNEVWRGVQNWTGELRGRLGSATQWLRTHPWPSAAAITMLLVVTVAAGWLLTSPDPRANTPRARQYRDLDVCLLTDAHGITVAPADVAWQALQDVSARTAVRVSYVPVAGPATPANAGQFLAGLVQRQCRVVVAVGAAQVSAVEAAASRSPRTGFVVVGKVHRDQANVVAVDPSHPQVKDQLTAAITRLGGL